MKTKLFLAVLALMLCASVANAQAYLTDPKYGPDEESRKENVKILNFFQEAYKMKAYNEAAGYLATLLQNCPGCSQNLYIYGANIYKNKIKKTTDSAQKEKYVDSLLIIYDMRIDNFGDNAKRGRAYILGVKALDYNEFRPDQKDKLAEILKQAVDAGQVNADPTVVGLYFKSLTDQFQEGKGDAETIMTEYERVLGYLEDNDVVDDEEIKQAVEGMLVQSGVADCGNIEKIFKPKYEADPNNLDLIKKILGLLQSGNCTNDFQTTLIEKWYEKEPSPAAALKLAGVFEERKDHAKALSYMEAAIAGETDSNNKSNHLVRASGAAMAAGNNRAAADYARQAIEANPQNGAAQFFLAQAYAGGVNSACSEFDRQAAFWLICDILSRARTLLENDPAQVENINTQIRSYSAYFPKTEECFFRDIQDGQSYTVRCGWITGTTTVRSRK